MNCRKCGAELREDQKVCIVCGTRTAAGGEFYVEEEKAWRPSRAMLIGAGVIVLALIIVAIANSTRVTPPGTIALEWFDAMSQRQSSKAKEYLTPALQEKLGGAGMDQMAIADSFWEAVNQKDGKPVVGSVKQEPSSNPNTATVIINVKYPTAPPDSVVVRLVKTGRAWRINELISTSI